MLEGGYPLGCTEAAVATKTLGRAAPSGGKGGKTSGRSGPTLRLLLLPLLDERVMTDQYAVQGEKQQMAVVSQRGAQKMLSEHAASKKKGDAPYGAMKAVAKARAEQLQTKRLHDQSCQHRVFTSLTRQSCRRPFVECARPPSWPATTTCTPSGVRLCCASPCKVLCRTSQGLCWFVLVPAQKRRHVQHRVWLKSCVVVGPQAHPFCVDLARRALSSSVMDDTGGYVAAR